MFKSQYENTRKTNVIGFTNNVPEQKTTSLNDCIFKFAGARKAV